MAVVLLGQRVELPQLVELTGHLCQQVVVLEDSTTLHMAVAVVTKVQEMPPLQVALGIPTQIKTVTLTTSITHTVAEQAGLEMVAMVEVL